MAHEPGPNVPAHLNGHHQHTYDSIFRHPVAHNLEWHDVHSLLVALADVSEGHNGSFHVTRNGQTITIHAHKHKDIASVVEVLAIRRFLECSSEPGQATARAQGVDLIVVIDHHETKIYRAELRGTIPERIEPYDPHGFRSHLHSKNPETAGRREPERKSYYEAIAKTLRGADSILIFGTGTGESSAMDQLLNELTQHHQDLVGHIIGSFVIDEHHTTEGQLLAKARETFERLSSTVPAPVLTPNEERSGS